MFFSYDPGCGFETFATLIKAREAAENALEYYRDDAADGWSDEARSVCYGQVLSSAEEIDLGPAPEDSGVDSYIDYRLTDPIDAQAEIDLLRAGIVEAARIIRDAKRRWAPHTTNSDADAWLSRFCQPNSVLGASQLSLTQLEPHNPQVDCQDDTPPHHTDIPTPPAT